MAWYGIASYNGEVFHFFVFGIRVGVHLREDFHHLVDAPDNIAISIANKISALLKVDTQVIKVQSYGSSHHAESWHAGHVNQFTSYSHFIHNQIIMSTAIPHHMHMQTLLQNQVRRF